MTRPCVIESSSYHDLLYASMSVDALVSYSEVFGQVVKILLLQLRFRAPDLLEGILTHHLRIRLVDRC